MAEDGLGQQRDDGGGHVCMSLRNFGPHSRGDRMTALERGGVHEAVVVNCKRGAITENQGVCPWYMG